MANRDDRTYRRLDVTTHRLQATLVIINANRATACLVPVRDLSKTGIGLYTKFEVDHGTPVRIALEDFKPADGKVVWCGPAAADPSALPTHPFRLGIEFAPKDDADRDNQLAMYHHISKLVGDREAR